MIFLIILRFKCLVVNVNDIINPMRHAYERKRDELLPCVGPTRINLALTQLICHKERKLILCIFNLGMIHGGLQ